VILSRDGLIDAYLFGEHHPYGKYSSFADFDALKQETLVDFYKKYYQAWKIHPFCRG
jgi:hypothetical protein